MISALFLAAAFGGQFRAQEAPSVVVAVLDDVGWDALQDAHTPTFDDLQRRGVTLERFYSAPSCAPTRYALFAGAHGFRGHVGTTILSTLPMPGEWEPPRPDVTLFDAYPGLALVGKWHLGVQDPLSPAAWGAASWRAGHLANIRPAAGETMSSWRRQDDGWEGWSTTYATVDQVDAALRLWPTLPRPACLVVAFNDAHGPPHDPPAHLLEVPVPGGDRVARFQRVVQALDLELGRMLEGLQPDLVLVLGDNGTNPRNGRLPLGRGKGSLYEGGIRVPFVACGRGLPAGITRAGLASVVDVPATLTRGRWAGPDGRDLWPLLTTGAPVRDVAYSQAFKPNGPGPRTTETEAAVGERWKLIRRDGVDELFDLELDPLELAPLPAVSAPARELAQVLEELGG